MLRGAVGFAVLLALVNALVGGAAYPALAADPFDGRSIQRSNFHIHSLYSWGFALDGGFDLDHQACLPPEPEILYYLGEAGLDAFGFSDHGEKLGLFLLDPADLEWDELGLLEGQYLEPAGYVMRGFEWTGGANGTCDPGYGNHVNIFGTDAYCGTVQNLVGDLPYSEVPLLDYDPGRQFTGYLYGWIRDYALAHPEAPPICQFNHPWSEGGTDNPAHFADFARPNQSSDLEVMDYFCLIEVAGGPNQINPDYPWVLYHPISVGEPHYRRALQQGWHVAPAIGDDNWMLDSSPRSRHTAVWAASPADVPEALRERCAFASENPDLELKFWIDDGVTRYRMGSTVTIQDSATLHLWVREPDSGTLPSAPLVKVMRDTWGIQPWTTKSVGPGDPGYTAGEWTCALEPSDIPADGAILYVRVETAAGDALSAPIWVKRPPGPTLTAGSVTPTTGTASTDFVFLVHYESPVGSPADTRLVYVDGVPYQMALFSGTASDGVYQSHSMRLPVGNHNFSFYFTDSIGGWDSSDWYLGPTVTSGEPGLIGIMTDSNERSSDVYVEVGVDGPLTRYESSQLPVTCWAQPGAFVAWSASTRSSNHTFDRWEFLDDAGNEIAPHSHDSGCAFTVNSGSNIHATAYFNCTPQTHSIAGRVTDSDTAPLPDVALELSGYLTRTTTTASDGTFLLTGIPGGQSYTLTPRKPGYEFSPPARSYPNLVGDQTSQDFTGYILDFRAPQAYILVAPAASIDYSEVTFQWSGVDDSTPTSELLYSYRLEGYDPGWSSWTTATQVSRSLPNGGYTFAVKAKDAAGNESGTPAEVHFIVNADPRLSGAANCTGAIWASRITVGADTDHAAGSAHLVLTDESAQSADQGLIPVEVRSVSDGAVLGAHELAASQLGVPALLSGLDGEFVLTIPDGLAAGGSMSYDIVWGKLAYFGWDHSRPLTPAFADAGHDRLLAEMDSLGRAWYLATRVDSKGDGWANNDDWWLDLVVMERDGGALVPQTTLGFAAHYLEPGGTPEGAGYHFRYRPVAIVESQSRVWLVWEEEKEVVDETGVHIYRRYAFQIRGASDGAVLVDTVYGDWIASLGVWKAKADAEGKVWLTSVEGDENGYFYVFNPDGSPYLPRTLFATASGGLYPYLWNCQVIPAANKVWLLYEKEYETALGHRRTNLCARVYDLSGTGLEEIQLTSAAPDDWDGDDRYRLDGTQIGDSEGKLWLGYYQDQFPPSSRTSYWQLRDRDGTLLEKAETAALRWFAVEDHDRLVWASEGSNRLVFGLTGQPAEPAMAEHARPTIKLPTPVRLCALDSAGFSDYDRWSPEQLVVTREVAEPASLLKACDLDLWGTAYHVADLALYRGSDVVWKYPGELVGYTEADISSALGVGENVFTSVQSAFDGGQVLFWFQYVRGYVPPAAPSNFDHPDQTIDSISWTWTDNSDNEDGFVVDPTGVPASANATSAIESGLNPNTSYTRHAHAYNAGGYSPPSNNAEAYTLPKAPSVTCDKSPSTPYPADTVFTFTNAAGWGPGNLDHYHHVWDQNETHPTWTSSEPPVWSSGTLPLTGSSTGSWYLHAMSHNPAEEPGGTDDYGPYVVVGVEADFSATPRTGAAPLSVQFTDLSANSPTSWAWDFGDGSTSIEQSPTHQYALGSYTVSLTATNAAGSDTETKPDYIQVGELPAADFSATPTTGAVPLSVQFSDLSANSPTSWAWDFGDGATSTERSPAHEYADAGTYTVALTARNDGGSDTETKGHYVHVTFPDVPFEPEEYWALHEILACADAGIVQGYPSGDYQPTEAVTRAQMAVYISRALVIPSGDAAIPDPEPPPSFSDVPADHWACRWVEYAVSKNVVQGYSGGSYHPDEVVNRGQMAVYVARALVTPTGDAAIPDPEPPYTFTDVPGADNAWAWCLKHMEYLAGEGIVQGYWDGTYRPGNEVTRDQMAVYVARAFELPL